MKFGANGRLQNIIYKRWLIHDFFQIYYQVLESAGFHCIRLGHQRVNIGSNRVGLVGKEWDRGLQERERESLWESEREAEVTYRYISEVVCYYYK